MADDAPLDIAAAGLASAAAAVERMLELGRAAASGIRLPLPVNGQQAMAAWGLGGLAPDADGADGGGTGADEAGKATGAEGDPVERARQARRFRADAERLVEMYADWTRMLVDGAASLAEQAVGLAPTAAGGPAGDGPSAAVLVLGPASAGATTTTSAWLHVLDGPAAAPAALHATDLVAHDGGVVARSALACTPALLDTSHARSSSEVRVSVVVPAGTAPGTYHGHLLAQGLPEVVLALRLEVVA